MKLRFICLLLCIFIISPICIAAIPEAVHSLEAENQLLKSELELAKKPHIYFIFDSEKATISLKSRGMEFKKMKIEDIKFWGAPVNARAYTLLKRSSLFKPKREKIKPQKTEKPKETKTFEIKALELEDMPTSYRLTLNEGIVISVSAKSSGVISALSNTVHRINWYLSRPILTLWNSVRGKPFTAIYITLTKEDARSLYWHFPEGTKCIIYNPS